MELPGSRLSRVIFLLLLPMVACLGAVSARADVIIDNGGSGTSSTGTWQVSGGTLPYGSNSLWARDGAKYTWTMTSQPAGTYEVHMWWSAWSSRTTSASVKIVHGTGSNTVSVNQQQNAGRWNSLGQFYFNGTGTVTITASNGATVSTCADAVRFVNVSGGANQSPTAADDAASTVVNTPVTINVIANDTDDVGIDAASVAIVGAPANGAAVSNGDGTVTYAPGFGFIGTDTFTYTVADGSGAVSNPATVTVAANAVSSEFVIDNGDPGTSYTGTWGVSGAPGYYGKNSVWSRDGAKYTWTFTPLASGSYELSMWWTVWPSRSAAVPVDIKHSGGTTRVTVNQQLNGGKWNVLGRYTFAAGQSCTVTVTSQPYPSSTCADAVKFAYLTDVGNPPPTAVEGGNRHSLALMNDGTVLAWGSNDYGALGVGQSVDNSLVPMPIAGLTGVTAISGGAAHSLGLLSDGTVRAWGANFFGELGDGTTMQSSTPVAVTGLNDVRAIAAGGYFSVAVKIDGTVWAWGSGLNGQIGDGTTYDRQTPVAVSGLADVQAISAHLSHALALKNDGTVWAWGRNDMGQLGDGTTVDKWTPVQVVGLAGVTAISAGEAHSLALLGDGTVRAWGANFFGELGDGTTTDRSTPVAVTGLDDVQAISGGGYFSVALKYDGTVWTWGSGADGQIGDGTLNDRETPVLVTGLAGVQAICASEDHTLVVRDDETVWAWGYNAFGQLGDNTTTTRLAPVPTSGF